MIVMFCIELAEFYRVFENKLQKISFRNAYIVKTTKSLRFLQFDGFVSNMNAKTRKVKSFENILEHNGQQYTIINKTEISSEFIKKWKFNQAVTKKSTTFALKIDNDFQTLKSIAKSLSFEEIKYTQKISLTEKQSLIVLGNTSFTMFFSLFIRIATINVQAYYLNGSGNIFSPLFLEYVEAHDNKPYSIIDYSCPIKAIQVNYESQQTKPKFVELSYLKNINFETKLKYDHLVVKKSHRKSEISAHIRIENKPDFASIIKPLLNSDIEVAFTKYENRYYFVLLNDRKFADSEFIPLTKHDIFSNLMICSQFKLHPNIVEILYKPTTMKHSYLFAVNDDMDNFSSYHILQILGKCFNPLKNHIKYNKGFEYCLYTSENLIINEKNFEYRFFQGYFQSLEKQNATTTHPEPKNNSISIVKQDNSIYNENSKHKNTIYDFDYHLQEELASSTQNIVYSKDDRSLIIQSLLDYYINNAKSKIDVLWMEFIKTFSIENVKFNKKDNPKLKMLLISVDNYLWNVTHFQQLTDLTRTIDSIIENSKTNSEIIAHLEITKSVLSLIQPAQNSDSIVSYYVKHKSNLNYQYKILLLEIVKNNSIEALFIQREIEEILSILITSDSSSMRKNGVGELSQFFHLTSIKDKSLQTNKTLSFETISFLLKNISYFDVTQKPNIESYLLLLNLALFLDDSDLTTNIYKFAKNSNFPEINLLLDFLSCKENNKNLVPILQDLLNTILTTYRSTSQNEKLSLIVKIAFNSLNNLHKLAIVTAIESLGFDALQILSEIPDKIIELIGFDSFYELFEKSVNELLQINQKHLSSRLLCSFIHISDYILDSAHGKNHGTQIQNFLKMIWDKFRIGSAQYEIMLSAKYLNLVDLYKKKLLNRKIIKTYAFAWEFSNNAEFYLLQIKYAQHLCFQRKTNEALALLYKIENTISELSQNKKIACQSIPLYRLYTEILSTLPLTGKYADTKKIISKIESEIKTQTNYLGTSIFSVGRLEIYIAIINCFAEFHLNSDAEAHLFQLLEKVLPLHNQAPAEHLLLLFQKLWKTIFKRFPNQILKLVTVFEKIFMTESFVNIDYFNEYAKIFKVYKGFTGFYFNQDIEIPSIDDNFSTDISVQENSDFITFKIWLEAAQVIDILSKIDAKSFADHAFKQMLITNSNMQGFNLLLDFFSREFEKNSKNKQSDKLLKREISEAKERITKFY